MSTVDVVVAGLGGVGSATAAVLARRGVRVLGLDRFPPAHDRGASHGETRLVRTAYFEGAAYVPLLRRAVDLWDELGLLTRSGGLFLGEPGSAVLAGSLTTAVAHDLPHELIDAAEVARRFPVLRPAAGTVALLEPDAGWVPPEAAVLAQLARARAAGADLRHHEPVLSWRVHGAGVRVTTTAGSHDAGALVLAPGRWAGELLPELPVPLTVEPRTMHWFAPPGGAAAYAGLPVWIWELPDGTSAYGAPPAAGPDGGLKAGIHHSPHRPGSDWSAEQVAGLLAGLMPGLGSRLLRSVDCTYTLTPDHDPVVGLHPGTSCVAVACGFSGHGFKLTPVLGEVLADLATEGRTAYDLSLLDPLRPR